MAKRSDYEGRVLGSILRNPDHLIFTKTQLSSDDFTHSSYRSLFTQMGRVFIKTGTVDALLLLDSGLELSEELTLKKLIQEYPLSLSQEKLNIYIVEIKRRGRLAKLGQLADEVKRDAALTDTDLDELLQKTHRSLFDLTTDTTYGVVEKEDVILEMKKEIETFVGKDLWGFDTGWPTLNRFTKGLEKKQIWVVGAYTSVGKSWFCIHAAAEMMKQGTNVLYISTEMSEKRLYWRLVTIMTGISEYHLLYGGLSSEDEVKRDMAIETLRSLPVEIKSGFSNVGEVIFEIQKAKSQRNIDVVVVDFLQNLAQGKDEYQEISGAIRKLQLVAQREDVGCLVASQTNRESVKDDWQLLMGFKGSGAIESAADVAMILSRDKTRPNTQLICDIRKNRNGIGGRIAMEIDFAIGKMRDRGEYQDTAGQEELSLDD